MSDKADAVKSLTELPRRPFRVPAEIGPLLGLLGVFALFSIILATRGQLPYFLSLPNLQLLMHQNAIHAVVALGALFVIISGGIDLSVGSVAALAAVSTALAYKGVLARTDSVEWASLAAIAGGVGSGALCGLVNGLTISWLRLTPFVATLGMLSVARGVAFWLSDRSQVRPTGAMPAWVNSLQQMENKALFFDPGVWSAVLLAIAAVIVLRFTVFGRYCYAMGSNEATARLCGVGVERNRVVIYTLAGMLTGWAGILAFAQASGSGDPTVQVGLELEVIAAAVIGGASLLGGQGSVVGVLLGVLILGVLENGVNSCGVPLEVKYILIGVIVVANTALSEWQRRRAA
jgi:ribose transport system permease protein